MNIFVWAAGLTTLIDRPRQTPQDWFNAAARPIWDEMRDDIVATNAAVAEMDDFDARLALAQHHMRQARRAGRLMGLANISARR